ncbi:MAG TPA: helix-turn-helix domain-containing protein, partial [Thermomicrobiaceae bacterium]|nr:helix-turn-helix domain-containing protein [Thermomicrobiaceae bacterium]
ARHVLRLAGADEADPRPGPMVADGLTREELAELCGATASTVSRVLSAWDRQGLVVAERKRVTVTRPDELARIADGDVPAARSSD